MNEKRCNFWEWVDVSSIKPYEFNAKRHDETQIANVRESIEEFGWTQPIVVDGEGVIIIGHCRRLAALAAGMTQVPVVRRPDLSPEDVRRLRLLDNKTNESDWIMDLLAQDLADLDFSAYSLDWGIDLPEIDPEAAPDIDDVPELPKTPTVKPGQIWQLGQHRLMCGDAADNGNVKALVGDAVMDLLMTDPPYGVDYTGGTHEALKIQNDTLDDPDFTSLLTAAFKAAHSVLKPGGSFYCWHGDARRGPFLSALAAAALPIHEVLVWVKPHFVLGRQDYQWRHESCLYGWKAGKHYFTKKRNLSTVLNEGLDINELDEHELRDLLAELIEPSTVLHFDKPLRSEQHPTMKPVALIAELIRNSTRPGEKVLDMFGGSGTTLLACEQLGRIAYVMELDPKYCDVIIERWESIAGESAQLIST